MRKRSTAPNRPVLAGRHAAHWMVRQNDMTFGPISLDRLEEWIRSGHVPVSAELGLVGVDEWHPIRRALPSVKPRIPTMAIPQRPHPERPRPNRPSPGERGIASHPSANLLPASFPVTPPAPRPTPLPPPKLPPRRRLPVPPRMPVDLSATIPLA